VISPNGLLSSLWVWQHKDESNPFLFARKIYPSRNFRPKPNFETEHDGDVFRLQQAVFLLLFIYGATIKQRLLFCRVN